jgi:glycosyltransferase involved in cell wall biosynthesis
MPPDSGRPPVYVTHQNLEAHGGGASAVTAWVLQALWRYFDVRLATPGPPADFAHIDDLYGTSLAHAQVRIQELREPSWLRAVPPSKLKSVRLGIALADPVLRKPGDGLVFNTANEMTFGRPSVTYVHCPIRHRRTVKELARRGERLLRHANNAAFTVASGFDQARFRGSVCIANSHWTASALRRAYGITAQVIHPPVVMPARPARPLAERSPGFVCVGRFSADKRTYEAIEIVDELRSRGHDVHLHLVGSGSGQYGRRIERHAAVRPHVVVHRGISRAELADLLADHQFGLHMMRNEHFGMAVAEMASAGAIVIAHRSAGPTEILGSDWPALFDAARPALEVCETVLMSAALRDDLQERMEQRRIREAFSPELFTRSIRLIAADLLGESAVDARA